ncbi:putative ssDNA-specific exonuclease [Chlamydiales bacterium STE3]|nr:putative ssDNA-specific exonuclease [Chlamydiales bacterium STE3]
MMFSSFTTAEEPLWLFPKKDPQFLEKIIREFKIHPVIAQILISRNFKTLGEIHDYLYAKLPDLHDPFLMSEMPQAVQRVTQAIQNKEHILIYGDNDVDGMTGTALLTEFLQFLGAKVFFYISNRSMRRQSIVIEALEYAKKNECKLLITVDCGITAAAEITQVTEQGVDVIVTDHHEPTGTIPHCIATLNPKLVNNPYPNRDLTGVGVAFKLAHAITNTFIDEGKISPKKIDLKRYLDLVALGTISDMGALLGENRILVNYGLRQLRKTKRIGLAKLISISDTDLTDLSTYVIASKVAPRLNSLGRIANPQKGVELLLIRNSALAEKMAIELDLNNSERQKIEKLMIADVEDMILLNPTMLKNKAIVLASEKWHPGIIAILSTRISKHYNRPALMIAIDKELGKGSLRSIHEFPLLEVLKTQSDLLLNFGGHDFAAGLTLKAENIPEFTEKFIENANSKLTDQDIIPKLQLDAEVKFEDLTFDLMESIKLLEPFGNENPPPILYSESRQIWPPKVVGKSHVKLYLEQEGGRMLEGMAFNRAQHIAKFRKKDHHLRVAFTPQINNHQGPSIQLHIREIQTVL